MKKALVILSALALVAIVSRFASPTSAQGQSTLLEDSRKQYKDLLDFNSLAPEKTLEDFVGLSNRDVLFTYGRLREFDGGIQFRTTIGRPNCEESLRGTFWFTEAKRGASDEVVVCMRLSDDRYSWISLSGQLVPSPVFIAPEDSPLKTTDEPQQAITEPVTAPVTTVETGSTTVPVGEEASTTEPVPEPAGESTPLEGESVTKNPETPVTEAQNPVAEAEPTVEEAQEPSTGSDTNE